MPGIKGIGKLDRRITIQQEVIETNDFNESEVSSWEDVATVWARVEDDGARDAKEFLSSDQLTATRGLRFIIRYRTGLTEKMRIAHDDRYYGISAIMNPDRRVSTVIKALLLDET